MTPRLTRQTSAGVSLIELMVSLVIGLFLVMGATVIYVNTRKTADVDETVARLQETARYAMSVLEIDTRMANYWGVNKDGVAIDNRKGQAKTADSERVDNGNVVSSGNDCGTDFAVDVVKYIEANDNGYTLTCGAKTGFVASADTLTIRRTATTPATASASKTQLCVTRNSVKIITPSMPPCSAPAQIFDLVVNSYYVDKGSTQSTTYPSLRRKWLTTLPSGAPGMTDEEIVPGVEDMQIELGWNPGTTGSAVRYLQPNNASLATGQIVAVRVSLLVRAELPDFTYRDTHTYVYGDRLAANGTTANLNDAAAAGKAYVPNDSFRRMLVTRTFFVRNVVGT